MKTKILNGLLTVVGVVYMVTMVFVHIFWKLEKIIAYMLMSKAKRALNNVGVGMKKMIDERLRDPSKTKDQAIQDVIDDIWETYDVDKSGALDKEETKNFVQDTLGNLGNGEAFSPDTFDEVFTSFDKDNSGTVEKSEMVVFIKQLMGNQ